MFLSNFPVEKYNYTNDMNLNDWISGPMLAPHELKNKMNSNFYFGPYPNTVMLEHLHRQGLHDDCRSYWRRNRG